MGEELLSTHDSTLFSLIMMGYSLISFVVNLFAGGITVPWSDYQDAFVHYQWWLGILFLGGILLSIASILQHPRTRSRQSRIPFWSNIVLFIAMMIYPLTPAFSRHFPLINATNTAEFEIITLPVFLLIWGLSILPLPSQYGYEKSEKDQIKKELTEGSISDIRQSQDYHHFSRTTYYITIAVGFFWLIWLSWLFLLGKAESGYRLGYGAGMFLVIWIFLVVGRIARSFLQHTFHKNSTGSSLGKSKTHTKLRKSPKISGSVTPGT